MNITEKKKAKFEKVTEKYTVNQHPQSNRLYHIQISKGALTTFLRKVEQGSIICPTFRVHSLCTSYCGILFIRSGG